MNAVEKARLNRGKRIKWRGRFFSYCGFSYKAHHLKEENVSKMTEYMTGVIYAVPIWEHLSNPEILEAEVVKG